MAKNSVAIAILMIFCAQALSGQIIHSVDQMNLTPEAVNSHAGEEQWSVLQPIYGSRVFIPTEVAVAAVPAGSDNQNYPSYSRVKKLANGKYFMTWMSGSHGGWIFASTSEDLKNWSEPVVLIGPESVEFNGGIYKRLYVNMDSAVLPDGDILSVFMFWSKAQYKTGENTGLMTMRSKDNGCTWSAPQIIYSGACWEPYLLVLPNGTLHCYFTDSTPQTWNSGTSLIESFDGGQNWTAKKRVCRSYKYEQPNVPAGFDSSIYTDQMPCFRVLNDGKTLVGLLEDRLATPLINSGKTYHKLSVVYNDGFEWKDLGEDSEGPEHRHTNILKGTAGYVETFPSGEVAFSAGRDADGWQIMLADHEGNRFARVNWNSRWVRPIEGGGGWGAIEKMDSHRLIATSADKKRGVGVAVMYLNHRIDARLQNISLDGDSSEWSNDDALYLGAKDGCETILRAARDEEKLYLLSETLCPDDPSSSVKIHLAGNNPNKRISLSINSRGLISSSSTSVNAAAVSGKSNSGVNGYAVELALPIAELELEEGDYLRVFMETEGESFTLSDIEDTNTWQRILLR